VGPKGTRRAAAAALEVRRERNGLEQAGGDGDDGSGWVAGRAAVVEEAEPQVAEALAGPLRPRPNPPLRARRREQEDPHRVQGEGRVRGGEGSVC